MVPSGNWQLASINEKSMVTLVFLLFNCRYGALPSVFIPKHSTLRIKSLRLLLFCLLSKIKIPVFEAGAGWLNYLELVSVTSTKQLILTQPKPDNHVIGAFKLDFSFQCRLCQYKAGDLSGVYRHYENSHGYRGKREDVLVDQVWICIQLPLVMKEPSSHKR